MPLFVQDGTFKTEELWLSEWACLCELLKSPQNAGINYIIMAYIIQVKNGMMDLRCVHGVSVSPQDYEPGYNYVCLGSEPGPCVVPFLLALV